MSKSRTRDLIHRLKEIRNISTMKTASFHIGEQPFPFGAECTELVREATRLWRESWITYPLDEIIKELEESLQ